MKKTKNILSKFLKKALKIGAGFVALLSIMITANASAVRSAPVSLSYDGQILGGSIDNPNTGRIYFGSNFSDSTPDGNLVVFASSNSPSDFVPEVSDDIPNFIGTNIFVRNMQTGEIKCASCHSYMGVLRGWGAKNGRISADGRYVVYEGPNIEVAFNTTQIYRTDLQTGNFELVSLGSNGELCGNFSKFPVISNDGRYVGFVSQCSNLVPNYPAVASNQIFVRDMQGGQTYLASHIFGSPSTPGNADVSQTFPSMSGSGRFIVWTSAASNYLFLNTDSNGTTDVFYFDVISAGVNVGAASLNSTGLATANGASSNGVIAENSNSFPPTIAFASSATDLNPADTSPNVDIYCFKGEATARLVSIASNGSGSNAAAENVSAISRNGRFVAFSSKASNLVSNITEPNNSTPDVFLRDLQTNSTRYVSLNANNVPSATTTGASIGGLRNISDDGRFVAFLTSEPMSSRDNANTTDIYVRDMTSGVSLLASLNKNLTGGQNAVALETYLSPNGHKVLFTTYATNLFPGDSTSTRSPKVAISNISLLAQRPASDLNGDYKNDYAVFRPSENNWYSLLNAGGGSYETFYFGETGSRIAPGDYDGDARTDYAVFLPAIGRWDIQQSSGSYVTSFFGTASDIITPADFDGDGRTDPAYFRPSTATWFILQSNSNSVKSVKFGLTGDVPAVGDFDGDNRADFALFRPSSGDWWVLRSSDNGTYSFHWGISTDKPVGGDFDGDGKSDGAVFRAGTWYILNSRDLSYQIFQWGLSGDRVVVSDYDGDGKSDVAVFRPTDGVWYVRQSSDNSYSAVQWGVNGDVPVPSAYVP